MTTNLFWIVPAIGLDKAASGVYFNDVDIIRCTRPGASLSIKGEIAYIKSKHSTQFSERNLTSGVLSLTPNPVPPVVMIQSTSSLHENWFTDCRIFSSSSGTMIGAWHVNPCSRRML